MHPPWITFPVFFILLVTLNRTSGNVKPIEEKGDEGNATITRAQREIIERERRLIPYMTYYVTQNLNSNTPRQNIFIPVTSPRENVLHYDSIHQIQANNIQSITPQQYEPVLRIQNPGYLQTPALQAPQHRLQFKPKSEEVRILGQYYRIQPQLQTQTQPQIQQQVAPQQLQPETQPQVIKINPVPIDQKLVTPQIIKIIPVVTKIPSEDRSPKSYAPSQPQYTYTNPKISPLLPNTYEQNYYAGTVSPQADNSYQGNKVYAAEIPQQTPLKVTRIIPSLRPDKTKYTLAKIFLTTTTPSPYSNTVKFDLSDVRTPKIETSININQLTPTSSSISQPPINLNPVPSLAINNQPKVSLGQQQIYYAQKINEMSQVQPQNVEQYPRLKVPQEEDIKFVASVTPISVTNDLSNTPQTLKYEDDQDRKIVGVYKQPSLNDILAMLKEADRLPQNLTPDNIDNGIKTLALILERLQQQKHYQELAKGLTPSVSSTPKPSSITIKEEFQDHKKVHSFPQPSGTSTPGRPGIDYPIYSSIPPTKFDCSTQRYKGFFGDPDTKCQVWHYCDLNGGQASFLCPNGTIFSQVALTCDWWFNVKCASTSQLYVLNERLYKYILPFSPSFPEDYSGPVVDTYLAAKFKEMEAKSKSKALKSLTTTTKPDTTTASQLDTTTEILEESRTVNSEV